MAKLDGFLWSSVETQETTVQTDLPGKYRSEMSPPEGTATGDQLGTLLARREH